MKKNALIIGGSRGIGAELARAFAGGGYDISLTYFKSKNQAEKLAKEIKARSIYCDARSLDDIEKATAAAGKIDTLIVCAGAAHYGLITDITPREIDELIAVNLKSAIYSARAAVPQMVSAKSGNIIFISSIWGMAGASCEAVYSAAKAGVIGLTKALAKELAPSGIRVNCIAPGVINTDMTASLGSDTPAAVREQIPLGKLGEPADVAACALYLASAGFMTGQVISVCGGQVI